MTAPRSSSKEVAFNKELAARVLARRNLLFFTKKFHPSYDAGWVHEDICRRLEQFSRDVTDKKAPRLMLLVPPRHGKSELASIRFPAWHLGHHPSHEVINCGYNTDLPMKFSRKVREMMRDKAYQAMFSDTKLDPDSQSVEAWNTTMGGGFTAAGVGGGITGKGAHVLIIDDPIKNMEESDSSTVRDGLWDWYWSTAYTRLSPGGGVLIIQCMTGDTPVLMADGTERRLESVKAGDRVATYWQGALSTAAVSAVKASGSDSILRITTKSGKIVRSNGRHPFLVDTGSDLKWMRARSLTTAQRIVALKDSGASGEALRARKMCVTSQQSVEDSVSLTTESVSGLTATGHRVRWTRMGDEAPSSSTTTGLLSRTTSAWSRLKAVFVRFVERARRRQILVIGKSDLLSTTATRPEKSGGCSATTVMQESDILDLSPLHLPLLRTSDFILDPIVSVEECGVEEVFDLQVEGTENFIANGLVSHNTWWNDDDLAGRLQKQMRDVAGGDQFVVIKYPALAEFDEYLTQEGDLFRPTTQGEDVPEGAKLLRLAGAALHPERYSTKMLENYRANMHPRIWSALYQQNPVPDEGMYFKTEWFRTQPSMPQIRKRHLYQAWDYAIGEKQQNDYTVGSTILQDENNFLHVLDVVRFKGDTFTIIEEMLNFYQKWTLYPDTPVALGVEDGQIWRAIEPVFKQRCAERGVFPPYEVLKPLTDKLVRARALQGRMQQGRVVFQEADWLIPLKREFLRFPAGDHDDIVDSLAWNCNMITSKAPPKVDAPQNSTLKSWKEKISGIMGVEVGHMAA